MRTFRRHVSGRTPVGAIVVRLVRSGGEVAGFVRQVEEPDDAEETYPTEQKPVDQVLRLAENKAEADPRTDIYVELEAGLDWDERWGKLER